VCLKWVDQRRSQRRGQNACRTNSPFLDGTPIASPLRIEQLDIVMGAVKVKSYPNFHVWPKTQFPTSVNMDFSIDPSTVKFEHTRRGVNATATIVRSTNERIGEIHDVAEKIVASVKFVSASARAAFVTEATRHRPAGHSDDVLVSEYARSLLEKAEQRLLASLSTK
jgi:hypothetical protein